jgi:CheY-like chemotaxis protein
VRPAIETPQAALSADTTVTQEARQPRRRVLVVDDNHDAAESLAALLAIAGHETELAHDGIEALETAAAFRPDVVFLDIGLPALDGHETARRIRQQPWGKAMVLIALTGWGQAEDRRKSRDAGFNHHLVKPADPAVVAELVSKLPLVS